MVLILYVLGLLSSMYRDGAPMEVIPAVDKANYGNWLVPLAPGPFLMLVDVRMIPREISCFNDVTISST